MEVRSRSAQDRKLQTTRWDLWGKYDKIFNDKSSSIELKDRQKEVLKEGKGQSKVQQARLHPAIQRVESLEDMQIIGMKSAIHELQDLAQQSQSQALRKHPNTESIIYESPQSKQIKGRLSANKNGPLHTQSVQYYKEQIQRLKSQLDKERSKNQEYLVLIKRLENSNSRLDRQISLLLLKWQKEHQASQRISTLQQDFKQQLIINLELEEVLLRQKEKIQKKHSDLSSEENYKSIVKQLKYQLNEQRKHAEKEILSLKNTIEDKDNEISQLKQAVSKLKAVKYSENAQIIEPSTKISCNFMERFSNFSRDMQAKLSQQIVSTNPSLQDTATIDLQVNRKKSESQYSKGNCPSLSIPLIDAKIIKKRAASKTDRT